jgi:hypothetical protein
MPRRAAHKPVLIGLTQINQQYHSFGKCSQAGKNPNNKPIQIRSMHGSLLKIDRATEMWYTGLGGTGANKFS